MRIDELNLSVRTHNTLVRAGITTVERIKRMSDDELRSVRNLSTKCIEEVRKATYCLDCERSIYGNYKNCDVNIENNGAYIGDPKMKCKCKVIKEQEVE